MKSIRLVYMVLLLMVAGLRCQPKESDSESIRIKPSKARGEALGRTLLHLAPNWKVAERLINEGADVNAKDSFGMTPLHTAVIANRRDVAEVLVARRADINAKSHRGQTPLFWAVTKDLKDMAGCLSPAAPTSTHRTTTASHPCTAQPTQAVRAWLSYLSPTAQT